MIRARRTLLIAVAVIGCLLLAAPAAMAADGVGLYGRTDDKVVTFFAFGAMAFFVIVASLIQMRLDGRKERAREELERLRRP